MKFYAYMFYFACFIYRRPSNASSGPPRHHGPTDTMSDLDLQNVLLVIAVDLYSRGT